MRNLLLALAMMLSAAVARADMQLHETWFPNPELTNQDGEKLRFYDDVIKGKVVALSFIYTKCKDVCPADTAQMLQVQDILGDRVGKDIFFYSISIDPDIDTPEALKAYMHMFGVKPGWQFLTGSKEDVELIQKKLGLISSQASRVALRDHNTSLMLGNEKLGQWIKRSPYDHPMILANLLRDTLMNFTGTHPELQPFSVARPNHSVPKGEIIFRSRCMSCHTIGEGDKLGPDLAGVAGSRPRDWLMRWIREPNVMLAEKDPIAVALAEKYRNIPMPNFGLNEQDATAIIEYLELEDRKVKNAKTKPGPSKPH